MLHFLPSSSSFPLNPQFLLPKPTTKLRVLLCPVPAMSAASSLSSAFRPACSASVPSLGADETGAAAEEAFWRSTSPNLRGSVGVAIVWFRNDLRFLNSKALVCAWAASEAVLPVYCDCVDPRIFGGARIASGSPRLEH